MPLVYSEEFMAVHTECDPWDRMTPGAALRRVQEIGTSHCATLGIDDAWYAETKTAFVLSRMSLEVARMPRPREVVRIETRAYGVQRAVYHRVTSIHAADGTKLCEADGRWLLVDTERGRILRKAPPLIEEFFGEGVPAEEHDVELPKPEEELFELAKLRGSYTLCDRNGHVNNTRYADLMFDHLPIERLKAAMPRKVVLHFRSEIALEEPFALLGAPQGENGFFFRANGENKKFFEGFVTY